MDTSNPKIVGFEIHRAPVLRYLDINDAQKGKISRFWIQLATSGISWPICVPVLVARGLKPGPVAGITASVHGNELNGIPVIQQLFSEIDPEKLKGTVVGVLVSNVPGFNLTQRNFNDGTDLNHIMPGKQFGNTSEIYVYRLMDRIVKNFDFLIDLHTASFGRVNSYYIRADMDDETTAVMTKLHGPDIIVHNIAKDGTLRGAAEDLGISAITLEVGDPYRYQEEMIAKALAGIRNFMHNYGFTEGGIEEMGPPPVICQSSYWLHTQLGGLLEVLPDIRQHVKKGDRIGILRNIFGDMTKEYFAPEDGIVIGKSVNPVSQSGARIIHLGLERGPDSSK
jgi:uncharacterized protein